MNPLILGLLLQAIPASADGASSSPAPRFFARPLDYWQHGLRYPEPAPASVPNAPGTPGEWGQVVKLSDGSFSYQELPPALVRVLEQPTPEHIKAYFEWKLGRTRKILRAAELMKEYRTALAGSSSGLIPEDPAAFLKAALAAPGLASVAASDSPSPVSVPSAATLPSPPLPQSSNPARPFRVLYFRRDGCPPCTAQEPVLASWLGSKPEARLEKIAFGEQPELWRAHRVRGTPSLVLLDEETGQSVFREGLQDLAQLDTALAKARDRGPK